MTQKKLADYAMILDVLGHFSNATTETNVQEKISELFMILCSPERISYLPITNDQPSELHVHSMEETSISEKQKIRKRLLEMKGEYALTGKGDSFALRITQNEATLALIEIEKVTEPKLMDHYINLARNILPTLRLAISNARTFQLLQEAIVIRDEFISIASHELKNPLTVLQLQIQMQQRSFEKQPIPEADKRNFREIATKSDQLLNRLNRLINDMLDVSRISSGRFAIKKERFNLQILLNELAEIHSDYCKKANCQIHISAPSTLLVNWDRDKISQVISNIILNAIKYAGPTPITISTTPLDNFIEIHIKDEGPGIPTEHQEKIFERFERLSSSSTTEGLGLGLYIARKIVDLHGGTLRLKSAPNEGSTFIISLPA